FDAIERSRARELLDAATGAPVDPLPLAEIRRRLPAGTAVVTYTVRRRGLLVSVLTRERLRIVERPADDAALGSVVDAIRRGYDSPDGLPRAALERLWNELIAPLDLPNGERLVIVPDKALYGVPFAALLAP